MCRRGCARGRPPVARGGDGHGLDFVELEVDRARVAQGEVARGQEVEGAVGYGVDEGLERIAHVEQLVLVLADEEGGGGLEIGRRDGDFALGLVEAVGFEVGRGILAQRGGFELAEFDEHFVDLVEVGGAGGGAGAVPKRVVGFHVRRSSRRWCSSFRWVCSDRRAGCGDRARWARP